VVTTRLDGETIAGNAWWTLEQGKQRPGETVNLAINDGRSDCSYHFRDYYQDDGARFRDQYNINGCENPAWSVTKLAFSPEFDGSTSA
jgi:hypothetical protein